MGFPSPSTAPPWYSTPTAIAPLPTAVPISCNSLTESSTDTPATENRTNKSNNIDNDCPDDDDDDDVDCFPRQDKQPVLPQDISPTDTLPSLIESTTDTPTAPMNLVNNNDNNDPSDDDDDDDDDSTVLHDNRYYDDDDDDDTYGEYAYDAHAYDDDDDDDDSYASSSSEEGYDYNTNIIIDMYGNQYTITDNDIVPCDNDDKPRTIQAAQREINAILAGRTSTSSIEDFTSQAKREYDGFFLPNKNAGRTLPAIPFPAPTTYAKNDDHDAYLHHRWNRSNRNKNTTTTSPSTTKPAAAATATTGKTTAYAPIEIKDDPSVTPTLETLCTLDTCSSDPTYNDTDAILNITIWNQPIVQYKVPIQPNTRNRSRNPSIAVQHAMIGVYDRLIHPPKISCLLPIYTHIVCVVLSCFILLADSFTMVKIDDRYPDEWND